MIYTCTLNPSVDYLIQMEDIQLGGLNRIDKTLFCPGGKGINVSRVLNNLGIDNIALGFIGGFTGEFIKESLTEVDIFHDFIELNGPTRVNIKLKTKVETEINGEGASISIEDQRKLINKISKLTDQDLLVIAGSLPRSVTPDFYETVARICNEKKVKFIFDTSGPALKSIINYRPFLIKPNQHELGELVNAEIKTIQDAVHYAREILQSGPKNILVSLGGQGAVFVNENEAYVARIPKGEVKNTVGAGDSTVAGFVASYSKNEEKKVMQSSVDQIENMGSTINNFVKRIRMMNESIKMTSESSEQQSVLTSQATVLLESVVELANNTLENVTLTVEKMNKLESEMEMLGKVSVGLEKSSSELSNSIQKVKFEEEGELAVNQEKLKSYVENLKRFVLQKDFKYDYESYHSRELSSYYSQYDEIEAIWSNREDGTFVFSNPPAGLLNAKRRDWFYEAMDQDTFISKPYISAITKKPCLTISVAFKNDHGRNVGIVGIDVKLR